jgi:amino acid permease
LSKYNPPPTRYRDVGGNVIQDIWYIMKAHPEYVALFLLLFIGLVVLFRFILEVRVTLYVLVLLAIIAFVLTAILLYGMDKRKKQKL